MTPRKIKSSGQDHRFGGDWTAQKLEVLAKYLKAYTTALKDKPSPQRPFRKIFVDAFAGTGYRTTRCENTKLDSAKLLFPDLAETEPQQLLDGSAKRALQIDPPFDRYIFIELDAGRCTQLEKLKEEFPDRANRIDIRQGEANEQIRALCAQQDWRSQRAVLFLDPYGMQVEWQTIEAIAKTKAIDLWLLFPLGIGVNRLLTRSGDIPQTWRARLDALLGTEDWYDEFYRVEHDQLQFSFDQKDHVVKATTDTIGRYFKNRLQSAFAGGVAKESGVLRNSTNCPLYLLCFAAANEKGVPIALKIANHLLKGMR